MICHRGVSTLLLCLLPGWTHVVQAQLDYVDSSSGLQTPTMKAGDTELEFGDVNGDGHPDIVSVGDHGSPYIGTSENGPERCILDREDTWVDQHRGFFFHNSETAEAVLEGGVTIANRYSPNCGGATPTVRRHSGGLCRPGTRGARSRTGLIKEPIDETHRAL